MPKTALHKITVVLILIIVPACGTNLPGSNQARTLSIMTWNVESGDVEVDVIAAQLAAFEDVDLWGLTEVNARDADAFEAGVEMDESADFESIIGTTGGEDRLLILYDTERFEVIEYFEIEAIGFHRVRDPLVAQLRDNESGQAFLFMVNHLWRSDRERRHEQVIMLNDWAEEQTLPIIAIGDYNFDYDVERGDEGIRDDGFDLLLEDDVFEWLRPEEIVATQCTPSDRGRCVFNSVLDFIFVAGDAKNWNGTSEIIVRDGDFPDTEISSDHRPIFAQFSLPTSN